MLSERSWKQKHLRWSHSYVISIKEQICRDRKQIRGGRGRSGIYYKQAQGIWRWWKCPNWIVVMVVQLDKFTKNHWTVQVIGWIWCYVDYISIALKKKKTEGKKSLQRWLRSSGPQNNHFPIHSCSYIFPFSTYFYTSNLSLMFIYVFYT